MIAEIVGVSLALSPNEACYLPLSHRAANDLLAGGGLAPGQVAEREGRHGSSRCWKRRAC